MDRLIALIAVVQNLYSRMLFPVVVSSLIGIGALTIITAMLVGAAVIGAFYAAYLSLIYAGADPRLAAFGILWMVVAAALLFIILTLRAIRRLRGMPKRLLKQKAPQMSQMGDVVDSFLDGLLGKTAK